MPAVRFPSTLELTDTVMSGSNSYIIIITAVDIMITNIVPSMERCT